uniref:Peptidase A2 domain-containing protein n=1 Tax=Caenorhabditis japonica TaxID=281687 RepID=A0A8R1I6E7_CAEJA
MGGLNRYEDLIEKEGNELDDASKARLVLLKLDSQSYALFTNIILPKKPADLNLEEVVKTLRQHFGDEASVFRRRFEYINSEYQGNGLDEYAGQVKKRFNHSEWKLMNDEQIQCLTFICGLRAAEHDDLRMRALRTLEAQPEITLMGMVRDLKKMMGSRVDAKLPINQSMRHGDIYAVKSQSSKKPMHHRKLHRHHPPKQPYACHRCNGDHWERECWYKDAVCNNCQRKGHIAKACHASRETSPNGSIRTNTVAINHTTSSQNHQPSKRIFKNVVINGQLIRMQFDTGADVTLISQQDWIKLQKPSLHATKGTLRSVNNKQIKEYGAFNCKFEIDGQAATGTCRVADTSTLLGMDWISKSKKLYGRLTGRLNAANSSRLEPSRIRTIATARLQLPPNAKPIYRKTNSMSSAAIALIKEERERRQHRHHQIKCNKCKRQLSKRNGKGRTLIEYNNEMWKHQSSPNSLDSPAASQHPTTSISTAAFGGPDVPKKPNRHRRKARLVVICGRSTPAVANHAANILLAAFNFTQIEASSKKFLDEDAALSLLHTILSYATVLQSARSEVEIRGAQRLTAAVCDLIAVYTKAMDEMEASKTLSYLCKRLAGQYDPLVVLPFISKLAKSRRLRHYLQPLFVGHCDYTAETWGASPEGAEIYNHIARGNFSTQTLIEIVQTFLEKEVKEVIISSTTDPIKLVQYLISCSTPSNSEIVQALAFMLYSNTKLMPHGNAGHIDMDVQAADTITTARLGDSKYTQPVKDALVESGRESLQRRLEIFGPKFLENTDDFVKELKCAPVQRKLVTSTSVAHAMIYMIQCNYDLSEGIDKGKYEYPLYWTATNFIRGVERFVDEQGMRQDEVYDWYEEINWMDVLREFDTDALFICRQTFVFFAEAFPLMFPDDSTFPIGFFYTPWKCWECQMHMFKEMVEHPDIWSLARYPHTKVLTPELNLKAIPDDTPPIVQLWNCLEFSNYLLTMANAQPQMSTPVRQIFETGFIQAGDVSTLALILSPTQWTQTRQEFIRHFLPLFILKSSNMTPVLNLAWNDHNLAKHMRPHILWCLTYMYSSDNSQLAKILDVAHDIKPTGLSELLNQPAKHLHFMVDLACLASKRDYLNLEKWLEDKEKAHGEALTVAVLQYIQKKYQHAQLSAALAPGAGAGPQTPSDPLHVLVPFVTKKARKPHKQQFPLLFQVMKENSGRSSSVSSGGHQTVPQQTVSQQQQQQQASAAVYGSGIPPAGVVSSQPPMPQPLQQQSQPPSLQQQISQSSQQQQMVHGQAPGPIQPPIRPSPFVQQQQSFAGQQHPHMMQPPPGAPQPPNPGMNMLLNMSPFGTGNTRDLLKVVQPAPPPPPSMSPSTQMMRSLIPPLTQRQNSQQGWHGAPAPSQGRPSGPPTPQQMDFRGIPTNQIQDFVPGSQLQRSGSVSGGSLGSLASQVKAPGSLGMGSPMPGGQQANANQMPIDDISMMTFAEDIQEEANSYFEKIYSVNNAMSVDNLIDLLKRFKVSRDRRERNVLACVVKNLFEEYRFFHEYPERELRTTAAVYGGIIREDIITNVQFATAVRKVIESLNADSNSMLYTFGTVALQHCRNKLCAYPKVCQMIENSANFSKMPQLLKDYVTAGVKGELPPVDGRHTPIGQGGSASSTPAPTAPPTNWGAVARAASVDPKNSLPANRTGNVLSYTNVDTLVMATTKDGAEIAQPAEAVVDKISFLFNNLSQSNLMQKKDEVAAMIEENGESFTRWLSQYIVMKRVSIEQNFQPLYNQFVTAINNEQLDQFIKRETFRNIRILLRSDKKTGVASNYSDRQLLKNLGNWLGAITIARNKPILLNDLDMKSLLLEAYYKGQAELLFVVPFISKILMACAKTTLFTASCAWIKSILKVLAELHNEPDLKINLKFEIEVLCKELGTDISSMQMDGILKDTEKLVRVTQQLCEVRQLTRPEAASPVQSQIRMSGSAEQLSGMSPAVADPTNKPATPQPTEAELAAGGGSQGTEAQVVPNVTHYAYHDINVLTYDGLIPHVKIVSHLPLFQLHPHAKHLVRPAMIHAIKELITPVTERALKIAMTVTESLVRKDFALDPDEQNLRAASFHMMRAMTAGMAMITCRDPLASTMHANLAQAFSSSLRSTGGTPEMKQMIEEASSTITQDNVELCTNFIVKTACEKATQEIEKRLDADYQKRTAAKTEGTPFRDEATVAIHAHLPKAIATQPGPTDKSLMSIYEQFSSRICGFKANAGTDESSNSEPGSGTMTPIPTATKEFEIVCQQLQIIIKEVDQTTQAQPHLNNAAFQTVCLMRELMQQVITTKDAQHLISLITRSTEHLLHAYRLEGAPTKHLLDVEWARRLRDLFIGLMRLLQTYFPLVDLSRRITTAIMQIRSDYKWNMEGIEILFKQSLLQSALWDQHLAGSMDNGGNMEAVLFAQKFVRTIGGGDMQRIQYIKEKFPQTCEQLTKLHQLQTATRTAQEAVGSNGANHHHPQQQQQPPVTLPMEAAPLPQASAEAMAQKGYEDQEMNNKVEIIMREWIQLCYSPTGQRSPQESLAQMIQLMHEHGVLATDDKITQFFRLCVENCVDISVRIMRTEQMANGLTTGFIRHRCYYTLDAFVKLMALMIRHSDNGQSQNKINLLKKLLNIIVGVLHMDHEVRKQDFNAMPYHRILISLFNEITGPDPLKLLEPIAWSILEAFGQTFFALQPRRMPGFAFAWLDIVGHRNVIGRLLANTGIAETVDSVKTAATYTQLIISHLKFLAPFLRNIQLPKSIAILYKGTLRVLLVILHDFPELLCEFHYVICDTVPPNCVQLRNLILSAYPRQMRLPDPFALNFKAVDTIPEMAVEPKSNLNMATIIPDNIRIPLDEYLSTRTPVDFLPNLPTLLQTQNQAGTKYNTTVMNALVLYVGIRAIEHLHHRRQRISTLTIAHTSYMDIFQNLAIQLDTEGRYLLFNGIANQLRYPNAHTHYFSCVFLYLFKNSTNDTIQEQITRILFERLVALRPHPWGLLITFIELIKNPTYNFWRYEFTSCAPEIQRLFQNVANTCVPAQTSTQSAAQQQQAAAESQGVLSGATTQQSVTPSN